MTETRTALVGAATIVLGPMSNVALHAGHADAGAGVRHHAGRDEIDAQRLFRRFAISNWSAARCPMRSAATGGQLASFTLYVLGSIVAACPARFIGSLLPCAAGHRRRRRPGHRTGHRARPVHGPKRPHGILNLIGSMQAVGPALAPSVGGLILGLAGWQPLFYVMVLWA